MKRLPIRNSRSPITFPFSSSNKVTLFFPSSSFEGEIGRRMGVMLIVLIVWGLISDLPQGPKEEEEGEGKLLHNRQQKKKFFAQQQDTHPRGKGGRKEGRRRGIE